MKSQKLNYPFSYGNKLNAEMALENMKSGQLFFIKTAKKISFVVVFTSTLWSDSLGFEKSIQSYFSNGPKQAIVRLVTSINGGLNIIIIHIDGSEIKRDQKVILSLSKKATVILQIKTASL